MLNIPPIYVRSEVTARSWCPDGRALFKVIVGSASATPEEVWEAAKAFKPSMLRGKTVRERRGTNFDYALSKYTSYETVNVPIMKVSKKRVIEGAVDQILSHKSRVTVAAVLTLLTGKRVFDYAIGRTIARLAPAQLATFEDIISDAIVLS